MHDNNLKTEEELQSWFIHDMERFFNGKGKEMIGWDEIIEGGLSKTATVMWWRSWVKDAATKATAQGNLSFSLLTDNLFGLCRRQEFYGKHL